ncbi:hypothetical protein [uncultured Litoreibacter sp.]|uniref:hypothetical protein n=1 Tax=uncultured Litoreibacter sp. TaxID=1392394 RepID=UPI0026265584|nr:hypothetical protein [uncultured Litoreibacter sp.]
MKVLLLIIAVSAIPLAAVAENAPDQDAPVIEGLDELAEGMRKLLEGFTDDMAPLMEDLADQLKGLNAYHPPEVLPNGDIIIRRKQPADIPDEGADDAIDI